MFVLKGEYRAELSTYRLCLVNSKVRPAAAAAPSGLTPFKKNKTPAEKGHKPAEIIQEERKLQLFKAWWCSHANADLFNSFNCVIVILEGFKHSHLIFLGFFRPDG